MISRTTPHDAVDCHGWVTVSPNWFRKVQQLGYLIVDVRSPKFKIDSHHQAAEILTRYKDLLELKVHELFEARKIEITTTVGDVVARLICFRPGRPCCRNVVGAH